MPKPRRGKVEFFKFGDIDSLWYWHVLAENGNVLCDGSEGYSSKAKARQGFAAAIKIAVAHQAAERRNRAKAKGKRKRARTRT